MPYNRVELNRAIGTTGERALLVVHRQVADGVMEPGGSADQFLVEQIRAGHQEPWRQLIDRYSGRLLAFARARVPALSDAEDLVQETFIGFLNSLNNFDASRSLETYLFTILRYKLYDLLRQRKTNVISVPDDSPDWWDRITPGHEETPSGVAVNREAREQQTRLLADVLRQLIHDLRDRSAFTDLQVIELLFFGGQRNLDVAELLDIDQKTVAGIKFRAIQKLQKFLSQHDEEIQRCLDDARAEVTVCRVWRDHRLTCLKRSTLGSYALGVLDEPWQSYTQFHLDVVGCPLCLANLSDLQAEESAAGTASADTERLYASSVGFLRPSHLNDK